MSEIVKEVRASELPEEWRNELGVGDDAMVRVAMEQVKPRRSPEEVERLLKELRDIKPIKIEGDITSFIRSERERIDGRSTDKA